ncbi:MAG TPA: PssD/Cps14F family polysaccharide biosynthesis glycosyltransferase [Candidatus Binataceae bacterium]|nr:PssD/Cps14F family polysaccharide biosynthesis glycosyltransferase [Candidatus Binataceae bacterium]
MRREQTPKLLLVCSAGGHLLELLALQRDVWSKYERVWVTLRQVDSTSLLKHEKVWFAFGPTNRNYLNLIRNLFYACRILLTERPTCVISSGAGIAIPFLYLSRLLCIRTIYLESFARYRGLSLTGRIVYPIVHDFLVQAPEVAARFRKALYRGSVF